MYVCVCVPHSSQFHDLSKESENGRLLRLLIKLGFVVERPQGDVVGGIETTHTHTNTHEHC